MRHIGQGRSQSKIHLENNIIFNKVKYLSKFHIPKLSQLNHQTRPYKYSSILRRYRKDLQLRETFAFKREERDVVISLLSILIQIYIRNIYYHQGCTSKALPINPRKLPCLYYIFSSSIFIFKFMLDSVQTIQPNEFLMQTQSKKTIYKLDKLQLHRGFPKSQYRKFILLIQTVSYNLHIIKQQYI